MKYVVALIALILCLTSVAHEPVEEITPAPMRSGLTLERAVDASRAHLLFIREKLDDQSSKEHLSRVIDALNRAAERKVAPDPAIVLGSCRIVEIIDGDTVEVERVVRFPVRLKDCWAAETRTKDARVKAIGITSKEALDYALGRKCRVQINPDGDETVGDGLSFGRAVGDVFLLDGTNMGESQVETGHAFRTKAELLESLR